MKKSWKTIVAKSLTYMLIVLMCFIILLNLYIGFCRAVTDDPVPLIFGIAPLIVLSGSMEPTLAPGDIVIIQRQHPEQYEKGDVVTYLDGRASYTHRIIGKEERMFILKGDHNTTQDGHVDATQLVGKMVFRIPMIGLAVIFFKSVPGLLLLATTLFLVLCGEVILNKIRRVEKER